MLEIISLGANIILAIFFGTAHTHTQHKPHKIKIDFHNNGVLLVGLLPQVLYHFFIFCSHPWFYLYPLPSECAVQLV